MLPPTLATFALLGAGLVFAIIELGLGAYVEAKSTIDYRYRNSTYHYKIHLSPVWPYLLFTSIWTILTTPFAVAYPFLQSRKAQVSQEALNRWLAPVLLSLYFVTLVFWMAAFADIANVYQATAGLDAWAGLGVYLGVAIAVPHAALAFGVLAWLVYTAIFILTILAVCNVLPHDLPGYQPLVASSGDVNMSTSAPTYHNPVPMSQDHHIIHQEAKNDAVPEMVA